MLENSASEQGSRMSAMDNATRNAGEMVDKLTIQYNRSRQAAITKELIEIISGAERSFIHQINGSPLNSIVDLKTVKRAKSSGICNNIGRQVPNGFTPFFLYRSICACCSFCWLFLCFSFSLFSSGVNACIALVDS